MYINIPIQCSQSSMIFTTVWRYPAAVNLMKMAGWEEDGDCVRLRDESYAKAISELLKQELQIIREPTPKRPSFHENMNTGASSSSKCCALTEDTASSIAVAIRTGNGHGLKKLLSPYHTACVKNMQVGEYMSIIAFVCLTRQIGIARILVNEYGVDFNSLGDTGCFMLFKGCNSTESCQSLITEFIKELKINVHRPTDSLTALHLAVLHKLLTVIKFLVEDYKVDVNCVSHIAGNSTALHMAYGIVEESIARNLIEHGADQDALDRDGRKPMDYKLYENSTNFYACLSQFFIKERVIFTDIYSREHVYFKTLCQQGAGGVAEQLVEAVELTLAKFPSLKENLDGDIANQKNLDVTPTLNDLNHYITEMAPSYYNIGLELDIVNSKLKVIQNDPSLPDLEGKCHKMLEVWLESNTSATWKKLCGALQEVGLSVLAERIKNQL